MSFRGGNRGNYRGGGGSRGGYSKNGQPPAKKFRADDDDEEGPSGTFEERLAEMLDEEDNMMHEPSTAMEEVLESHEEKFVRWRRPPPPELNIKNDKLIFQQLDIDHYIAKPYPGMPGARSGVVPVMRMFGVTKAVSKMIA